MKPLRSGYRAGAQIGGPSCERLERELEEAYRIAHARVVNSATSALHAALVALEVGGGEVIVPAYTMSASAAAVLHADATPVFADIGDDYCVDWDCVRRLATPNTRAVVLVHLFGRHATVPADITLPVVHDCAQSPSVHFGMSAHGRRSDCFVLSFNQHKVLSCGEGGAVLTDSDELARRVHLVRNHGEVVSDILGWNYRMTEMQADIMLGELPELPARLRRRREWAAEFCRERDVPYDDRNVDTFLLAFRTQPDKRWALASRLGGRIGYHRVIPTLPYFAARGYTTAGLDNAVRIEEEIVVVDPEGRGL